MAGYPYDRVTDEDIVDLSRRVNYLDMRQKALEELNETTKEAKMAKEEKDSKLVNRHKRMAEGEKIELKKGGMAKSKSKPKKK